MASHPPNCHLGPQSPLGTLNETNAKVLLAGVSFAACTAFHLAEYQVTSSPQRGYECVIRTQGKRGWYQYHDVLLDDSDFEHIGKAFEASDAGISIRRNPVGEADCRLFPLSKAVAFARTWMSANRSPTTA